VKSEEWLSGQQKQQNTDKYLITGGKESIAIRTGTKHLMKEDNKCKMKKGNSKLNGIREEIRNSKGEGAKK
jgi:hypothetical protein